MAYLSPSQGRPIVSSIDLISPQEKYSLILSRLDLTSTPNHGNSIPLLPTTAFRVDGISMNFHWCGDYLYSWRVFVLDTPPKTSIFGHLMVKADQLTQGERYGRAIDLSEGQGHIPYMEYHVLLKVMVDHLTTLGSSHCLILISTLHKATTNL